MGLLKFLAEVVDRACGASRKELLVLPPNYLHNVGDRVNYFPFTDSCVSFSPSVGKVLDHDDWKVFYTIKNESSSDIYYDVPYFLVAPIHHKITHMDLFKPGTKVRFDIPTDEGENRYNKGARGVVIKYGFKPITKYSGQLDIMDVDTEKKYFELPPVNYKFDSEYYTDILKRLKDSGVTVNNNNKLRTQEEHDEYYTKKIIDATIDHEFQRIRDAGVGPYGILFAFSDYTIRGSLNDVKVSDTSKIVTPDNIDTWCEKVASKLGDKYKYEKVVHGDKSCSRYIKLKDN
jgi:hypothetical protein